MWREPLDTAREALIKTMTHQEKRSGSREDVTSGYLQSHCLNAGSDCRWLWNMV